MCIALRMVFASLHTLKKQISAYCEKKCDLKPLGDADWRWCDRDAAWPFPAASMALTDKLSCAARADAGRRRDIPRVCFPSERLLRASIRQDSRRRCLGVGMPSGSAPLRSREGFGSECRTIRMPELAAINANSALMVVCSDSWLVACSRSTGANSGGRETSRSSFW